MSGTIGPIGSLTRTSPRAAAARLVRGSPASAAPAIVIRRKSRRCIDTYPPTRLYQRPWAARNLPKMAHMRTVVALLALLILGVRPVAQDASSVLVFAAASL